jgi:hypothetical protein
LTNQSPKPETFHTPLTQPDSLPAVFLNHFYVVLDSSTCRAVEENAFLQNHFAAHEKRTTTNADITYTGLYFYGIHTYFELFDVAESPGRGLGDSGVAFGVDQPGAIRVLEQKFATSLDPSLKTVTRLYRGKQIPWFFMATPRSLPYESELSSWVMEYHPEFLASWNPRPSETNRGISRKDVLKRYSEVLEPVNEPYLEDVTGLTVAADERTRDNLMRFCLQLGYQIESDEGGGVALHGPDLVLLLIPATANVCGIREVKMRTRPHRNEEQRLGRSILRFMGSSAIWSFH